jgi:hypothetical protein
MVRGLKFANVSPIVLRGACPKTAVRGHRTGDGKHGGRHRIAVIVGIDADVIMA